MLEGMPVWILTTLLGGVVGFLLGFVARLTRFCTLSAVETAIYGNNWLQLRMWVLAIAVAIAGTGILIDLGLISLESTVHYLPRVAIAGPIVGGLLFGIGMAAVGTCGFGSILRAGGGDMRGMVTIIIVGVTGYITIRGLLAIPRLQLIEPLSIPLENGQNATLHSLLGQLFGLNQETLLLPVALFVSLSLAAWCFSDRKFRLEPKIVFGGAIVGLLVVMGWYITANIGADAFDPQPIESLSFVSAAGNTVIYLMTFTGATATFSVGVFVGTLLGAFIAAAVKHELRLDGYDEPREMRRHILGANLMGIGGVLSMGCSVGQGLSGVSSLAIPSFFALTSMWLGAAIGLHVLIHGWTFSSQS